MVGVPLMTPVPARVRPVGSDPLPSVQVRGGVPPVAAALPLLKAEGILFAATNSAKLEPETFLKILKRAIGSTGRKILRQHYAPQPPDFPVCREEPVYLKTVWLKLA